MQMLKVRKKCSRLVRRNTQIIVRHAAKEDTECLTLGVSDVNGRMFLSRYFTLGALKKLSMDAYFPAFPRRWGPQWLDVGVMYDVLRGIF